MTATPTLTDYPDSNAALTAALPNVNSIHGVTTVVAMRQHERLYQIETFYSFTCKLVNQTNPLAVENRAYPLFAPAVNLGADTIIIATPTMEDPATTPCKSPATVVMVTPDGVFEALVDLATNDIVTSRFAPDLRNTMAIVDLMVRMANSAQQAKPVVHLCEYPGFDNAVTILSTVGSIMRGAVVRYQHPELMGSLATNTQAALQAAA